MAVEALYTIHLGWACFEVYCTTVGFLVGEAGVTELTNRKITLTQSSIHCH